MFSRISFVSHESISFLSDVARPSQSKCYYNLKPNQGLDATSSAQSSNQLIVMSVIWLLFCYVSYNGYTFFHWNKEDRTGYVNQGRK